MKKLLTSLAVLLLCLFVVPSTSADAAAKLSKTKATVYVGNKTTLKVKGTKKKVTWSTSDKKVATVKAGKVTAKKKGTAVITAKVGSKKYKCKVTVKNQSLNKTKVTLTAGKTATLKLNGAFKKVTWTSSNKKVVTVTKSGKVKAIKAGTAKVTAKHNGKTYTCKVTVKAAPVKTVVVRVDKEIIEEQETKSKTDSYLKILDIKSQKTDKTFVYYTVTETSYKKLMSTIKGNLDSSIAKAVKGIDYLTKITYNSSCTVLNLYVDTAKIAGIQDMPEEEVNELLDYAMAICYECVYYQAFSGVRATDMDIKMNIYDSKTNKLIESL